MSFSRLPPELQEAIIINLIEETLASLCLVSRSMLALARPFLYREVGLAIFPDEVLAELRRTYEGMVSDDGERGEEEGERDEEEGDYGGITNPARLQHLRRIQVYKTFEARPEWGVYVRQVILQLGPEVEEARSFRILASFSTLQSLSIIGTAAPSAPRTLESLIDTCPRTVTVLEITHSGLPSSAVFPLIAQLPLLEHLGLGPGGTFDFSASDLSFLSPPSILNRLHTFSLLGSLPSREIFAAIANASPSLTRLKLDFHSVQALDHTHLSNITHLSVMSSATSTRSRELSVGIKSVLQSCTSLTSFELLDTEPFINDRAIKRLESGRILQHLPDSLRQLTLISIIFTQSYLVDFLSTSNIPLRSLDLSPLPEHVWLSDIRVYTADTRRKIDEVCARRNIRVRGMTV